MTLSKNPYSKSVDKKQSTVCFGLPSGVHLGLAWMDFMQFPAWNKHINDMNVNIPVRGVFSVIMEVAGN